MPVRISDTATDTAAVVETETLSQHQFTAGSAQRRESASWIGRAKVETPALSKWNSRWKESKGMLLVLVSEMFGACMAGTTRLLELGEEGKEGMSTLQILFVRFSITLLLSSAYMWYAKVPHFPLGLKSVRWLLVLRGATGFCAVFCFYYSLRYLPLTEAIVIFFLTPLFTAYASSLFLHEPFSRRQLLAGVISLVGIVIMANPFTKTDTKQQVSTFHRLMAVGLGLVSDLGATCAYTSIRAIGERAHPLMSINYYAIVTTVLSTILLASPIVPGESFRLPNGSREWALLTAIGISGFLLQAFLTMGLLTDHSAKATNMMYVQVIFGLLLDWSIWGVVPGWESAIGGAVVVGATLWGVLEANPKVEGRPSDEEYAMVAPDDFVVDEGDSDKESNDEDE